MTWGKRLGVATVVVMIGSVAGAAPAGTNTFVPVSMTEEPSAAGTVVVAPGDHLWKISDTHLEQVLGRPAEAEEVAPYWRSVIEINRDRLRSGDPDLIYPGEVVTLPPDPEGRPPEG